MRRKGGTAASWVCNTLRHLVSASTNVNKTNMVDYARYPNDQYGGVI